MAIQLETKRLRLTGQSLQEALQDIEALPAEMQKEISPKWLAAIKELQDDNPWLLGFKITLKENDALVGQCGFKGEPDSAGMVEIAYGIAEEEQGKGFATEAAGCLLEFAFRFENVQLVRAHTLPAKNASTRVLTKNGFLFAGQVEDPEDGPVWRWEVIRD